MNPTIIWNDYFEGRHDAVLAAGASAAEIMHITGLSLIALGRFEEASTLLMSSSLVNPLPQWYSNACVGFLDAGKPEHALTFALTGTSEFPENADMQFNAASVFTALERHDQAMACLAKSLEIAPSNWEATMNLGNTLRRLGRLKEALECYDKGMTMNPDTAGIVRMRLNKAVTLSDLGHHEIALQMFDTLSNEKLVDSPEMDFNRATLSLKLGDYTEGWRLYMRRWDCPMAKDDVARFRKPMLISLEEGRGKRVLLCHEQGFGDSIQFVRYAPMLAAAGIDVTILVPTPLARLISCFGLPVVTSRDDIEYDFECPMLNAPMLFGTTVETIPAAIPYLTVPQELIDARKLPDTGRLKVGLVWAGQSRDAAEMKILDSMRSIPVSEFFDLLNMDVDVYSLQFGDRADEPDQALPIEMHPIRVLEPTFDFLDTAAVIKNLDLVIAVDTSTAHLAAAVGVPVWILSRFDGCWRWLKNRDDSPWYPPVVRLFHQKERLQWKDTIKEVVDYLNRMI